ncbi:MAG: type II secretion system protein [Clostridium sp.]|jgi:type IV pilus assembly protein PilA|nr:type II secretion system protein [Clostridium sp.]
MKRKKKRKGFTLVELLIVIGISGILMAMAAPKYQGMVDKATQLEQRAHAREVLSYVDIYNLDAKTKIADTSTLTSIKSTILIKGFSEIVAKANAMENMTIGDLRLFAENGTPLPPSKAG